jgi:Domain of unknown function (DUF397)
VSSPTPWIKASKSADNNACVEMRSTGQAIEVRDSKNHTGPVLTFTPAELDAWMDGAKRGEFDHLL